MNIHARIQAFHSMGQALQALSLEEFQSLAGQARNENPWFTEQNARMALDGIIEMLQEEKLEAWTSPHTFPKEPKRIALVLAGNIPMVGFHDVLAVLISGHHLQVKLSSKDSVLMKFLFHTLFSLAPHFREVVQIVEQLKGFDAVIATGSDNSARYFEYYFGKYPHIIRKNRTSVAVLTGHETKDMLQNLGLDIFSYFGLGCRNVSKIFVPAGYRLDTLFEGLQSYHDVIHHHKYCNNYDYQKSILLVNGHPFLDNNFIMLQESDRIVSPISVLYFEYYQNMSELTDTLGTVEDKIQCIVGESLPATVPFGKAQYPAVTDYADGVDTLKFLASL
jgi:hypothetical protein